MGAARYDPADFVVPPEAGKGKSQRVQLYIQSAHYRALNIIARKVGVFPWDERNDIIRYGIKLALDTVDRLEPLLIGSVVRQANYINYRMQEQVMDQKFMESIAGLRAIVQTNIGRGETDAAKEEVAFVYAQSLQMPNEPDRQFRWKMRYLDELERAYPEWIREFRDERPQVA